MANYTTSQDLVNDILFRAGENTDGTSDFAAAALAYLNRAYQALIMGGSEVDPELNEDWWWARKHPPGILNLVPSEESGTVSVTNNDVNITFSVSHVPAFDHYFFKVDDHPDIFRVSIHLGGTTAILDSVYTGPTGTGKSYKLMKLEYDLASDAIKIVSPMRIYQGGYSEIDGVELASLERDWPLSEVQSGPPTQFAFITESKIRFNTYGPKDGITPNLVRVEYDYTYRPADLTNSASEEPIVPRQYRKLLADIALTFLFVDKNDDRAQGASTIAKRGLQAMANEQRSRMINYSRHTGFISPRPSQSGRLRKPLRTDSGFIIG